ncbi:nucleotidyltransferase domain-containing protein [Actinoplanes sp. NEAU-A12]|uniref:Nucleotidyltransferase domain-containing protein n=1 Tax=Actinoplanes sandaracinus TaxID=3045177 RepID=A0ABT6WM99_9ACTN|nr:nucleotidyltransferase domain-containing protein [Actinoplanes sandaracinus]MDI6100851.1 nucleotidyltransferase domain-containing protein [Actinoplanes sandaracinus]
MRQPDNVLLAGIVGSTAYGLAGPGSDVDRLGLFATPTVTLHGLDMPTESVVSSKPDATFHEARKYCALALGGNPTVSELMWLPGELYEVRHPLGDELIAIRAAFLSAKRTRDAYLGYATQQFRRLEARGDGSFSADTRKRTAKHARHLLRLCSQGLELYTTGDLVIRLENPQRYRDFGDRVAAGDVGHARDTMARYEAAFDEGPSVLPEEPDRAVVEDWLLRVRAAYFDEAGPIAARPLGGKPSRTPGRTC